jgi:nucleoside-diphosphate-sugar epimerase
MVQHALDRGYEVVGVCRERSVGKLDAFRGRMTVIPGATNDRAVIERVVVRLIEGMKSRGARYIFHSDHSITPRVSYDAYRYALDVYRAHMWY